MSDALDRLKKLPEPELGDAAMDAAWQSARRGLARRRVRRTVTRAGLAAALVIAGALALRAPTRDADVTLAGTTLTATQLPLESRLSDGSVVTLAAQSMLRVVTDEPRLMRVELEQGRGTFEVAKNPERVFAVQAGNVEVRVVGTRFSVDVQAGGVLVAVERGTVDVASGVLLRRMTAGESIFVDAARAETPQPVESESAEREAEPVAVKPPAPVKKKVIAQKETQSPALLLDEASALRREGKFGEAASAWERFLTTYPHETQAMRIAYELGRVRMDRLHDADGAAAMFERVLAESKDASLAEDALARLVRLADSQHQAQRCRELRARYSEKYPQGTYRDTVSALCAE